MSKLNYEHVFNTLVEETAKYITKNNLKAMVLGISGGIDSTVVAAICHEVSKKTGIPLIGRSLPIKNKSDEFDVSELVGQVFCDDFKVVNLLNMYQHVNQSVYDGEGTLGTPISKGNIQARLRMIYLYNLASIHKGLVMSTDNQTEYQLGFWTIHGDVGDLDQIGAKSYYDVDRVLQTLTCKASPENDKLQDELTTELGPDVVGKITGRRFKSRFKRLVSPIIVPREMYD